MRGALIHGVLLAVMLVYGYRTWTRDKTVHQDHGEVVLWDKSTDDLVSLELKSDKRDVKIERKTAGADNYWWGTDTTIDRKPKPKTADAGSAAGSAGSAGSADGSGVGSAEMIETRKTKEFPLGDAGDKMLAVWTGARAMRDLGVPSDDQKKEFKLVDSKSSLTVTFKDGAHTFVIGGSPFGGGDRYAMDLGTGKAYVISKDLVSGLEVGETSLHLVDPRGFDPTKLDQVTIEAGGKSKVIARIQTGVEGQQVKTWGDPETKKADQTIANFIDNANNLRPTEYKPDVTLASLTQIVKLSFRDEHGKALGWIEVFKRDKPVDPAVPVNPANPPKPVTEYYLMSEKTRVPALLKKEQAERTDQDVITVFSDHPLELPPKPPGGPHGGNFKPGNGPLPPVPVAPGAPPGALPPHAQAPVAPQTSPVGGPALIAPPVVPPHGGATPPAHP